MCVSMYVYYIYSIFEMVLLNLVEGYARSPVLNLSFFLSFSLRSKCFREYFRSLP